MALQDWAPKRRNHAEDIAAIDDLNNRRPRIVTTQDVANDVGMQAVKRETLPPLTDLQHIAVWFKCLSFNDMVEFCNGVVGEEKAMELAAQINKWQKATNEAAA